MEVSVRDSAHVPTRLKSGRLTAFGIPIEASQTELQRAAEESFCSKGLSLYANELATVSALARRIVDLALTLHWDTIRTAFREEMTA